MRKKLDVILDMQVSGIVVITDMKDFSFSQFQWLITHPGALKERITSIQDGVPMRIKVKNVLKYKRFPSFLVYQNCERTNDLLDGLRFSLTISQTETPATYKDCIYQI